MEEGSVTGTKTTAAARDPTAGCDVACSECVAEVVGAADGSAAEGSHAVGTMPLYAKPVLAAGRAAPQKGTLRTTSCSTAESPSELGGGLGEGDDAGGEVGSVLCCAGLAWFRSMSERGGVGRCRTTFLCTTTQKTSEGSSAAMSSAQSA